MSGQTERRVHPPRPQRVLIVDDSDDIRSMWGMWLTYWGFDVDEASNGAEAVDKALARTPDLVLMDLWMPVMDGLSAVTELRAHAATAQVPILALSADHRPDMARRAGCDDFLEKPVHPDDLIEHMRAAFARIGSESHRQPPPAPPS